MDNRQIFIQKIQDSNLAEDDKKLIVKYINQKDNVKLIDIILRSVNVGKFIFDWLDDN